MDELSRNFDAMAYPDVVELGGLGAGLRSAARPMSVDLGEIAVSDGISGFWNAGITADRGHVRVNMSTALRSFSITIDTASHVWASGATDDLASVVLVADAWRRGVALQEMLRRFPFLSSNRIAQAYEDGNPAEVGWEEMRHDATLVGLRPLLEAAGTRLGTLLPSVTHTRLLHLWIDPWRRSAGELWIRWVGEQPGDNGYEFGTTWTEEVHHATTAGAVVDMAVGLLQTAPKRAPGRR